MRKSMKSYLLTMLMAQAMIGVDQRAKNPYSLGRGIYAFDDQPLGLSNPWRVDPKQLHKFSIKGHEIEAYSKKDAIKRLKYKGLI